MADDTKSRHSDRSVENCSYMKNVQDTMLTYSKGSRLSKSDPKSLSLSVSLDSQETTVESKVIIDFIKASCGFHTHFIIIQDISIASCQNFFDCLGKKHKPYCDVNCFLGS